MTHDPFVVTGRPNDESDFEPVPAGVHLGGCAAIVFSPNMPGYQGGAPANRFTIVWIIPAQLDQHGHPRQVRRFVNMPANPMHAKAGLRKMLEQWIGRPLSAAQILQFSMRDLLTRRAQLTTQVEVSQQTQRRYAKVIAISPPPPGLPPWDYTGVVVTAPHVDRQTVIYAPGVTFTETQAQVGAPAGAAPTVSGAAGALETVQLPGYAAPVVTGRNPDDPPF